MTAGSPEVQVRGSSLLLAGRFVYIGITLAVQVLIVRSLSLEDYGDFAYALALVLLVENFSHLGLDRAVPRFTAIYHEQKDMQRLFGMILLVLGTVVAVGVVTVSVTHLLASSLGQVLVPDDTALALLLILIVMAPLNALDQVFESLMAVFARPSAIVLRKHIIGPLLRLAVVAAFLVLDQGVEFLARGYVLAVIIGLLAYLPFLFGILSKLGLRRHLRTGRLRFPVREAFGFSLPLMSGDVAHAVRGSLDAIVLGQLRGAASVAALRAVQPAARLNEIVSMNFALLYTPHLSRVYAREAWAEADQLYWRTASWQAVLSFPIFAVTFGVADFTTFVLFDERYVSSAPILATLAAGLYASAALGPNSHTLRVFGRIRYVVFGNLAAAALNVVLLLVLVPAFGAWGAALAVAVTVVALNVYNQVGLGFHTPIRGLPVEQRRVYATIVVAAAALGAGHVVDAPVAARLFIAAATSIGVLVLNRRSLAIAATFPEVARVPVLGRLVGAAPSAPTAPATDSTDGDR